MSRIAQDRGEGEPREAREGPASSRPRSAGLELPGCAGSTKSRAARPPSQTAIAPTWMTLTGKLRATGRLGAAVPGERRDEDEVDERGASRSEAGDAGRPLGRLQDERDEDAEGEPGEDRETPDRAELGFQGLAMIVFFIAEKPEMPAASAPSRTIPAAALRRAERGATEEQQRAGASANARAARASSSPPRRAPARAARRAGGRRGRRRARAIAGYCRSAGEAEGGLGHLAVAGAADQFGRRSRVGALPALPIEKT